MMEKKDIKLASPKKSVWLLYDLGLRSNYHGLFTFLDNHNAIECGAGLAYLVYENKKRLTVSRVIEELIAELREVITPLAEDRIYLIWRDGDKITGRFVIGKRKPAPWAGYGARTSAEQIDESF